jgi:uncharacterized protein with ParB-like and HNH nuclease domain
MANKSVVVQSGPTKLRDFFIRHEIGEYGLPEFQRTFVWAFDQVKSLWDSLYHRYPIGQILLWEPPDPEAFPMRALGLEQPQMNMPAKYGIIDGQQRLTAIYLVLTGMLSPDLVFDVEREMFVTKREAFVSPRFIDLDLLNKLRPDQLADNGYFDHYASQAAKDAYRRALNRLKGKLLQLSSFLCGRNCGTTQGPKNSGQSAGV